MDKRNIPLSSLRPSLESLAKKKISDAFPTMSHNGLPTGSGKSWLISRGLVRAVGLFEQACKLEPRHVVAKRWRQEGTAMAHFGVDESDSRETLEIVDLLVEALGTGPITIYYIAHQQSELEQFEADCDVAITRVVSKTQLVDNPSWKADAADLLEYLSEYFGDTGFKLGSTHPLRDDNESLGKLYVELRKSYAAAVTFQLSIDTDKGATKESADKKEAERRFQLGKFYRSGFQLVQFLGAYEVSREGEFGHERRYRFSLQERGKRWFKIFLPFYFDRFGAQIYTMSIDKSMLPGFNLTDIKTPLEVALNVEFKFPIAYKGLLIGSSTKVKSPNVKDGARGTDVVPLTLYDFVSRYRAEQRTLMILEEEEACHKVQLERLTKTLLQEGRRRRVESQNGVRVTKFHMIFGEFFSLSHLGESQSDSAHEKAKNLVCDHFANIAMLPYTATAENFWIPLANVTSNYRTDIKYKNQSEEEILNVHIPELQEILNSMPSGKKSRKNWGEHECKLLMKHFLQHHDYAEKSGISGHFKFLATKLRAYYKIAGAFSRLTNARGDTRSIIKRCEKLFYQSTKSIDCSRDLYDQYQHYFQNILFTANAQILGAEFLDGIGLSRSIRGDSLMLYEAGVEDKARPDYISLKDYLLFTIATIRVCKGLLQILGTPDGRGTWVHSNEESYHFLGKACSQFKSLTLGSEDAVFDYLEDINRTIDESYIFEDTKSIFSLLANDVNHDGSTSEEIEIILDASQIRGTPENLIVQMCGRKDMTPTSPSMLKFSKSQEILFQSGLSAYLEKPVPKNIIFLSATSGTTASLMGYNRKYLSRSLNENEGKKHFALSESERRFAKKTRETREATREHTASFLFNAKPGQDAEDFGMSPSQNKLFNLLMELVFDVANPNSENPKSIQALLPSEAVNNVPPYFYGLKAHKKLEVSRAVATLCKMFRSDVSHGFCIGQTMRHINVIFSQILNVGKGVQIGQAQRLVSAFSINEVLPSVAEIVIDLGKVPEIDSIIPDFGSLGWRPVRLLLVNAETLGKANRDTAYMEDEEDDAVASMSGIESLFNISEKNLLVVSTFGTFSKGLNAYAYVAKQDGQIIKQDPAVFTISLTPFYNGISRIDEEPTSKHLLHQMQLGLQYVYGNDEPTLDDYLIRDSIILKNRFKSFAFYEQNLSSGMYIVLQTLGRADRANAAAPRIEMFLDGSARDDFAQYFSEQPHKKDSLTFLQASFLKQSLETINIEEFKEVSELTGTRTFSGWVDSQLRRFESFTRVLDALLDECLQGNNLSAQKTFSELKSILTFEPNAQGIKKIERLDYSSIRHRVSDADIAAFPTNCFTELPIVVARPVPAGLVLEACRRELRSVESVNESYCDMFFSRFSKGINESFFAMPKVLFPGGDNLRTLAVELSATNTLENNIFKDFLGWRSQGATMDLSMPGSLGIQPWAYQRLVASEFYEQLAKWYIDSIRGVDNSLKNFSLEPLGIETLNEYGIFEKADLFYLGTNLMGNKTLFALDAKNFGDQENSWLVKQQESRIPKKRAACEAAAVKMGAKDVFYGAFLGKSRLSGVVLKDTNPVTDGFEGSSRYCSFVLTSIRPVRGAGANQVSVIPHKEDLAWFFKSGGA